MNGEEVNKVGEDIERRIKGVNYLGCYLADECYRIEARGGSKFSFAIINILSSKSPRSAMGHYILVGFIRNSLLYFDSYGLNINYYSFYLSNYIRHYKNKGYRIIRVGRRLQGMGSLVCGLYSLYIAYILARYGVVGIDSHIRRKFTTNFARNDRIIVRLCYRIFKNLPECIKTFCVGALSYDECRRRICSS